MFVGVLPLCVADLPLDVWYVNEKELGACVHDISMYATKYHCHEVTFDCKPLLAVR